MYVCVMYIYNVCVMCVYIYVCVRACVRACVYMFHKTSYFYNYFRVDVVLS